MINDEYYHVMNRGNGKQTIFENYSDYKFFLRRLLSLHDEVDFDLLAYCLMRNHYHLLIRTTPENLSLLMLRLGTSYAKFYNTKYEHTGHVFQGPYLTNRITSQHYFEACIRYIHNNPVEAGLCDRDKYFWSSYQSFLAGYDYLVNVQEALRLVGGRDAFLSISESKDEEYANYSFHDCECQSEIIERGLQIIRLETNSNCSVGNCINELTVMERNRILRKLKAAGLSNKSIEMLTGVSKYIISRA